MSSSNDLTYRNWNPIYIKDSGLSNMSESESYTLFNITNLAPYRQMPDAYLGHVFMCRPNLNLTTSNIEKLKQLPNTAGLLTSGADTDMIKMLGRSSSSRWLPIVTNKAKSYTVNDFEIKTVEKAQTYYGHTIRYGKHNEEYKHGGTISIEFRNDSFRSILKTMWFWAAYIYSVTKEEYLDIDFWDIWNGELDYPASLYYLVTKRDGRELVYWEELVGIFPRRIPISDFSWNDNYITSDSVSIDFEYNIRRDPLDPGILADINCLTINNIDANNYASTRIVSNGGMVLNDVFGKGPIVKCSKKPNGQKTYWLEYVPASDKQNNSMISVTKYF